MRILKTLASWQGLLAVIALAVLSACVVVDEGPGPRPIPDDGPRFCTREYAPVCARDGSDRRTFGNSCEARRAGYRVIQEGECRRGRPEPEEAQICTRQYDPVCGERRGERRTFGNSCEADAAGYTVVRRGECRREQPERSEVACTREYVPVCGRRGDNVRTFGNACEARAAEYRIVGDGPC